LRDGRAEGSNRVLSAAIGTSCGTGCGITIGDERSLSLLWNPELNGGFLNEFFVANDKRNNDPVICRSRPHLVSGDGLLELEDVAHIHKGHSCKPLVTADKELLWYTGASWEVGHGVLGINNGRSNIEVDDFSY
jgi:hypothetical protein